MLHQRPFIRIVRIPSTAAARSQATERAPLPLIEAHTSYVRDHGDDELVDG